MRKLFFILMCIPFYSIAQMPVKDGKVAYEQIDTVTLTRSEIYNTANIWFAKTFHSAKDVLQVSDKDNGELIGKGNLDFTYKYMLGTVTGACWFTIEVTCKDSRFRIRVYDLYTETGTANIKSSMEEWIKYENHNPNKKVIESVDIEIRKTIAELETAIKQGKKDDF